MSQLILNEISTEMNTILEELIHELSLYRNRLHNYVTILFKSNEF